MKVSNNNNNNSLLLSLVIRKVSSMLFWEQSPFPHNNHSTNIRPFSKKKQQYQRPYFPQTRKRSILRQSILILNLQMVVKMTMKMTMIALVEFLHLLK